MTMLSSIHHPNLYPSITSTDRPQSGELYPSTQDLIIREEFHFKSKTHSYRSLKFTRRFSKAAVLLAAYQLAYGVAATYFFSSSYNYITTLTSMLSLVLSLALAVWSSRIYRREQERTLLTEEITKGKPERALYIGLLLRALFAIPILINQVLHREFTSQKLIATGLTTQDEDMISTGHLFKNLATPMPFIELALQLTYIHGARTVFQYVSKKGQTMTRLVFYSSLVLMASSLGLIFSTHLASDQNEYFGPIEEFPEWLLPTFQILGVVGTSLSGLVWLFNQSKWRVPYIFTTMIVVISSLGLLGLSGMSYKYSTDVFNSYKSMSDLESWSQNIAVVHEQDLADLGCPAKYLPKEMCDDPLLDRIWGKNKTVDGKSAKCLNTACDAANARFYANPFLSIANLSLISMLSGIAITIGVLYFWHTRWTDIGKRRNRDIGHLFVMLGFVLIFFACFAVHTFNYQSVHSSEHKKISKVVTVGHVIADTYQKVEDLKSDVEKVVVKSAKGVAGSAMSSIYHHYRDNKNDEDEHTTAKPEYNTKEKHVAFREDKSGSTMDALREKITDKVNEIKEGVNSAKESILSQINKESKDRAADTNEVAKEDSNITTWSVPLEQDTSNETLKVPESNWLGSTAQKKEAQSTLNVQDIEGDGTVTWNLPVERPQVEVATVRPTDATTNINFGGMTLEDSNNLSQQLFTQYSEIFQKLNNKEHRCVVLSHNSDSSIGVKATPWTSSADDFKRFVENGKDQATFCWAGEEGSEQLQMILQTPNQSSASSVLNGFGLNGNVGYLNNFGLSNLNTVVVNDAHSVDIGQMINGNITEGEVSSTGPTVSSSIIDNAIAS